jgi:Protein of unknown function (DUF1800)
MAAMLDPAEAWQPWQPSSADPWGRKWAAHLYRRAAFGASREDLVEAERLGPDGTLDVLLRGKPRADELVESLVDVGLVAAARDDGGKQLRGWWLYCMLQGGHPLREKLTLFWHNHFATSIAKVQNPLLMFRQNCLLRTHALGKFGPFLQAMSKDAAMLIWLDSNSNIKGKPNENYAREVMELFSLGVGHYTERDIREAARAFTGWHTDGNGFAFNAGMHDAGPKTVFGRTGNWNGDDVVRIILEQPPAARFLVRKLYHFFISERAEPPDSFLEPLAESLRRSDYDIAGLVRTLLSSRHFYSEHAFRQRVKSPVEYVLGAVQAVYQRYREDEADYRPLRQQALVNWLGAMGQHLFAPPNVKGWPGGRAWLNTSTMLERANFAAALAMGTLWNDVSVAPTAAAAAPFVRPVEAAANDAEPAAAAGTLDEAAPPRAFDPARVLEEGGGEAGRPAPSAGRVNVEQVVGALLDLYLPGGVRPEIRQKLVAFVTEGKRTGPGLDQRVREAVHAILAMPEYQLA